MNNNQEQLPISDEGGGDNAPKTQKKRKLKGGSWPDNPPAPFTPDCPPQKCTERDVAQFHREFGIFPDEAMRRLRKGEAITPLPVPENEDWLSVRPDKVTEDVNSEVPFNTYYCPKSARYLVQNARGEWIPLCEEKLARWLQFGAGVAGAKLKILLNEIEGTRSVSYYGPLAGRMTGARTENGRRIIVTSSPKIPKSEPGDWRNLREWLEQLFGVSEAKYDEKGKPLMNDDGKPVLLPTKDKEARKQLEMFFTWLKLSRESLLSGALSPGQAIALCGPVQCGKTLLIHVLAYLFGGRSASAFGTMVGKSIFNSHLFGAELLFVDDDESYGTHHESVRMAAAIKSLTVKTRNSGCHAKGQDELFLSPWWRLVLALNNTTKDLKTLPTLDAGTRDKIHIFKAAGVAWWTLEPGETDRLPAMQREARGMLHWLETEWEIPAWMERDPRMGVASYHHPDIMAELDSSSPEQDLLDLILDNAKLLGVKPDSVDRRCWRGTSTQLAGILKENFATKAIAGDLLYFPNACGGYLAKLEGRGDGIVRYHRTEKRREWVITFPTFDPAASVGGSN